MFSLAAETTRNALAAGRIGTPVALRIFAQTAATPAGLEPSLAQGLEQAARWLGVPPAALHAVGSPSADHAHVALGVRFADGRAAVISAGLARQTPRLELLVLGNRGVLSWEPDYGAGDWDEPAPTSAQVSAEHARLVHDALSAANETFPNKTSANEPAPPAAAIRLAPPYGVLLVAGSHTHQENYAQAFAADPRCRLVAVTDEPGVSGRRQLLNQRFARQLGIPHLDDLAAALARDDVQIVSICAEPERRGPIAVAAAQAGKQLYLDKPLAASVEAAAAIEAAVRESRVASQMFSQVGTPASLRARSLAASGKLGDLAAFHADLLFAKGDPGTANLSQPRREWEQPETFEWVATKREFSNVGGYPLSVAEVL